MSGGDSLGILGLLLCLFGGSKGGGSTPERAPKTPGFVPSSAPAAPWPQVAPTGLPPFPGSGWEYDEPPPKAVQQRAAQLVSALWKSGVNTFKVEQTEGRWIAYRAEKVRSGKQGVVAYRQAVKRLPAAGAVSKSKSPGVPQKTATRAPAATQTRSPGVPQKTSAVAPGSPLPASVLEMPDLKIGAGMPPAAPMADVVLVQQKLGVKPEDGRFGRETQTAVIKFQVRTGLAPNEPIEALRKRGFGAVKQATWTKLFAVRA